MHSGFRPKSSFMQWTISKSRVGFIVKSSKDCVRGKARLKVRRKSPRTDSDKNTATVYRSCAYKGLKDYTEHLTGRNQTIFFGV